jgi:hypothetical protein
MFDEEKEELERELEEERNKNNDLGYLLTVKD